MNPINPYGLSVVWGQGDLVSRTTLVLLALSLPPRALSFANRSARPRTPARRLRAPARCKKAPLHLLQTAHSAFWWIRRWMRCANMRAWRARSM